MKKFILFLSISTLLIGLGAQSSPPQGITYQAVAIDDDGIEISGVDAKGLPILDKAIKVKFSILADNANGTLEYEEEHSTNTDQYGMFSLIVGGGTASVGSFSDINWAGGDRFLKVELDINTGKGYKLVSTQQMMSVPYAMVSETSLSSTKIEAARLRDSILMAGNISIVTNQINMHEWVDKDTSALNEIQTIGINQIGNAKTINLNRNGGSVSFSVADEDSSSTNELQNISRTAGTVSLSRGGTINLPDSSAVNEIQTLRISSSKGIISLDQGGAIQLADSSASNELQALSKTGNVISLSQSLATVTDSDDQQLTLSGTNGTLSLGNGGTVTLVDSSATNELQILSVSNDTIFLSDGGFVKTPGSIYNWSTTGNTGMVDGTHFIGTINNAPLNFKVNNKPAGRIDLTKRNVFFGENAGISTTGVDNIGIGSESLYTQTNGNFNTAIGLQTMYRNTSGNSNAAIGYKALFNNTTGGGNTAIGNSAMQINSTGDDNIAIGLNALFANTLGNSSVALGSQSLYNNTIGKDNIAIGYRSLYLNTTGQLNTAIGKSALGSNTTGEVNVAIGFEASNSTTIAGQSVAIGLYAGRHFTIPTGNVSVGAWSNYNSTTGQLNTSVGYQAGYSGTAGQIHQNSTSVGYNAPRTASNQVRIGNSGVTSIGGYANWSNVSDERFKDNIQETVPGLDFINALRPVTYHLNIDKVNEFLGNDKDIELAIGDFKPAKISVNDRSQQIQSGFIAQEVEAAAKKLGYEFSGVDAPKNEKDHYGLRYAEFVVPLVKAMQEQQTIINSQNTKIETLEEVLTKLKTNNDSLLKRVEALEK